jgi:ABC-type multidrug transport system fused ATPase/permease subunit
MIRRRISKEQKPKHSAQQPFHVPPVPLRSVGRSQLAQLWLKSRIINPTESYAADKTDFAETQEASDSAASNGKLDSPLEDERANEVEYRTGATPRPLNKCSIRTALRITRLVWKPMLDLCTAHYGYRLKGYIFLEVLSSLVPVLKIRTMAWLLDLVQMSLSHPDSVPVKAIIWYSLIALAACSLETILPDQISRNANEIERVVDEAIQVQFILRKLSLDIPTAIDPYMSALVREAAVFAGFDHMEVITADGERDIMYSEGAFAFLRRNVLPALTSIAEIISTSTLLVSICFEIGRDPSLTMLAALLWITFVVILAFLPLIADTIAAFLFPADPINTTAGLYGHEIRKDGLRRLVSDAQNREEIVLFRLGPWIASRWLSACSLAARRTHRRRARRFRSTAKALIQQSGQVIFYVCQSDLFERTCTDFTPIIQSLVALQFLPFGLSLGSIKVFQGTAEQLSRSIQNIRRTLFRAFQAVFLIASWLVLVEECDLIEREGRDAVIGSTHSDSTGRKQRSLVKNDKVDYEATRNGRGMKLEAKNLSFKYPGASEYTLKDINLVIEPGTSLAIVGYNGSGNWAVSIQEPYSIDKLAIYPVCCIGKTTLLKVLIGLYGHEGRLLINDIPSRFYMEGQLHQRTTACFQDYSKHLLSLRDNVNLGRISPGEDVDARVAKALTQAEGKSILETVSLDSTLNPFALASEVTSTEAQEQKQQDERFFGRDFKSLSLGQWQKVSLARGFLTSVQADLVVFE